MKKNNTRSAQGLGTIRYRKDGRWEARYTVGRDPGTGKQIQKSVYGQTQNDVVKKLQSIANLVNNETYYEPSKLKVAEWLKIWISDYTIDLKPLSLKSYLGHINNHIIPALGSVKLMALRPHHIQSFVNKLNDTHSPKTIKNIHGTLHKALEQAIELDYINKNPADSCKLPRIIKTEIKPLDTTQISLYLKAIEKHQFEKAYIVALFTGIRQSELIGLTWDCINFESGSIYLYRQYQKLKGGYKFVPLKNDKTRTVFPAKFIINILRAVRTQQLESQLKVGSVWENSYNFVFTNEIGTHFKHETLSKNHKKIVISLGLDHLRFHDLRHSYAVASLIAGDDIKTLQENLGHHSASFTLGTYTHATDEMKKKSSERMDRLIVSL